MGISVKIRGRFWVAFVAVALTSGQSLPPHPQTVWFAPMDPAIRTFDIGTPRSGSVDYMSLFSPSAPWATAASHVKVFKLYASLFFPNLLPGSLSDSDLDTLLSELNRRNMALAIEWGPLVQQGCPTTVEGFTGAAALYMATRIKQLGGNLQYIAMDEPFSHASLYSGPNACQWTPQQVAANALTQIALVKTVFPNVIVGDIEVVPDTIDSPNWLNQYTAWLDAWRAAAGTPLAFFHFDVNWTVDWRSSVESLRQALVQRGIPFGMIYDGWGTDLTDADWVNDAENHYVSYETQGGTPPDHVIFQSWNDYPKHVLPESDPTTFTHLIDTYFRQRTKLASSIGGSTLQGALTAVDTSQPLGNASIDVTISPTAGGGVPALYTLAGTAPAGTQSVVFGARVNLECNCSGTADLLVSSFTMDAGAAGVITRDFSNQLNGWGVSATGSPAATAVIEGASLHVIAQPGQSVLLNTPPIPFTSAVPYTFRVSAQVSPKSSGSGYFTLIFLGAATEISRVRIPLAAASLPLGSATTDALGRYTFSLPATGPDPFQVQSSYAGSSDNWPAQNTATWTSQQSVSIGAVSSAASYNASAVSPGEIVVLFGSGFGPATLTYGSYANGRLTASIGQTTVRFDGIAAPLIYASGTQIGAIVPYGINTTQTAVTVTSAAGSSLSFTMPVASSVPGLFTADSSGFGPLAALNSDGTLNTANNPARPGDPVVLFGTGEGQTSPAGLDGLIMDTPATPLLAAAVTVGGQTAPIDYFGSAPGEVAGVFQLNCRIPLSAPSGNAVAVTLKIGDAPATKSTTIAIR